MLRHRSAVPERPDVVAGERLDDRHVLIRGGRIVAVTKDKPADVAADVHAHERGVRVCATSSSRLSISRSNDGNLGSANDQSGRLSSCSSRPAVKSRCGEPTDSTR